MNKNKCSIVALIGEPNAGKSTLLNAVIGQKISIVTHKIQTTRVNLRGVVNLDETQLVFIDTPGIFKPSRKLERAIVKEAWQGLDEADSICMLFDCTKRIEENIEIIIENLKKRKQSCYAIINKLDLVKSEKLLEFAAKIDSYGVFEKIFMISATKQSGVNDLLDFLKKEAGEGEWMFHEDELTDMPMRNLAEEITREQAFLLLHREIPYSLKVETDSWEDKEDGSVKITQTLYVQKSSQKSVVLGKGGSKIKDIGRRARHQIKALTGQETHLFLHVKVREDWIEKDF